MAHREENGRKETLPPLPRDLIRRLEKIPAAARKAIRSARQEVAGGADPGAAVDRLVRVAGVPLPIALRVFPGGAR